MAVGSTWRICPFCAVDEDWRTHVTSRKHLYALWRTPTSSPLRLKERIFSGGEAADPVWSEQIVTMYGTFRVHHLVGWFEFVIDHLGPPPPPVTAPPANREPVPGRPPLPADLMDAAPTPSALVPSPPPHIAHVPHPIRIGLTTLVPVHAFLQWPVRYRVFVALCARAAAAHRVLDDACLRTLAEKADRARNDATATVHQHLH